MTSRNLLEHGMELGAFSISLAVKDLDASLAFYRKLGFEGEPCGPGFAIVRNGDTVIGLFQGMFEQNILTFNPGWAQDASETEPFTDVRELAARLEAAGLELQQSTVGKSGSGPASFVVQDPDGNPVLIDQHR